MGVIEEVRTHLVGLGTVGAAATWFKFQLPPARPDVASVVRETGGTAPDMPFGSSIAMFENPTVQILCRGIKNDHDTPRATAKLVWAAMIAIKTGTLLGTTIYAFVQALQQPFPMKDEAGRVVVACNYLIKKDPS